VHPVEGNQLHPDYLGEVFDLLLDVLGADCEMMNSVGQTHDVTSVRSVFILCHKRAGSETVALCLASQKPGIWTLTRRIEDEASTSPFRERHKITISQ